MMIKHFENFKFSRPNHQAYSINESNTLGDDTSFWSVYNTNLNSKDIITREVANDDRQYFELIKHIQSALLVNYSSGFDSRVNGYWGEDTTKAIERLKNVPYDFESKKGGDKICRSFYKYLCYMSNDNVTFYDTVFLEAIQRPKLVQDAFDDASSDDRKINEMGNLISKLSLKEGRYTHVTDHKWNHVNTIEGINDTFKRTIMRNDLIVGDVKTNPQWDGDDYFNKLFPNDGQPQKREFDELVKKNVSIGELTYYRSWAVLQEIRTRTKSLVYQKIRKG